LKPATEEEEEEEKRMFYILDLAIKY